MKPDERKQWQQARQVFERLLEMPSSEQAGWLETQALDAGTRQKLEEMLRADTEPDPSLEQGQDWIIRQVARIEFDSGLQGRTIGGWTLDQSIGEGGMSTVYRCHRQVEDATQVGAIKLLRIGLLTNAGRARFQQEIRIIAGLQHPAIARLLDAGSAEDGTPYFVLEFVEGQPINAYVDQVRLEPDAVIEIFLTVCDAVAYAQQQLIVHRDIKPSNIIIDLDGYPRLLDFGIARLIDEEQAAVTTTRAYTPGYAAPEQLSGGAITLSTDVFGLGATLQRLLNGPSKSSSEHPGKVPASLNAATTIDRDLNNILQQATHEDPARRYRDAAALADDLRRWQAGRPVKASGDALSYRMRKFIGRNRIAVGASLLLLFTATAGITTTLWQASIAEREAREALAASARAEALNEFLIGLFEATEVGNLATDELPTTAELLDLAAVRARNEFQQQPLLRAQMLQTVGRMYMTQDRYEEAERLLREAIALLDAQETQEVEATINAQAALARTLLRDGRETDAIALAEQALTNLPATGPELLHLHRALADVMVTALLRVGDVEQALIYARSFEQATQQLAPDDPLMLAHAALQLGQIHNHETEFELATTELQQAWNQIQPFERQIELKTSILNSLAIAQAGQGKLAEALAAGERGLMLIRQSYPAGHHLIGRALSNLANYQNNLGRLDASLRSSEEALEILLNALGPDHFSIAAANNNLGVLYGALDRHEDALNAYREASRIVEQMLAPDDWRRISLLMNEVDSMIELARFDEAENQLLRAVELSSNGARADIQLATAWTLRTKLYLHAKRPTEAEQAALEAVARWRKLYPEGHSRVVVSLGRQVLAQQALGNSAQADQSLIAAEAELDKLAGNFDNRIREYIQDRTQFLKRTGRPVQAVERLERDLEYLEQALGPDHPTLTRFRAQIAELRS